MLFFNFQLILRDFLFIDFVVMPKIFFISAPALLLTSIAQNIPWQPKVVFAVGIPNQIFSICHLSLSIHMHVKSLSPSVKDLGAIL